MKTNTIIREFKQSDLFQVKTIIDDNQMFPSKYLDDMVSGFLNQETEDLWFVSESAEGEVVSIAYCAPERMTNGTWNLLLIAVSKKFQGQEIGSDMVEYIEQSLKVKEVRVLLVETSGLPEYELTRRFYPKLGFENIATIPEYYEKGEDKVIYWKLLKD